MHGPNEGVSDETDEANSAVKIVGGNVFVELDPDHPGFKDEGYRARRNEIAKIALEWNEMSMDERRTKKKDRLLSEVELRRSISPPLEVCNRNNHNKRRKI